MPIDVVRTGAHEYVSDSCEATRELGELCARNVEEGLLMILTGDLGAGKTQFTKGLVKGLGGERDVTSPTFTLMCLYDDTTIPVYHFDLYRLESADELGDAGVLDVCGIDGVSVVEWGEPFADEIGDDRVEITFEREGVERKPASDDAPAVARLFERSFDDSLEDDEIHAEPPRTITFRATGEKSRKFIDAVDAAIAEG
jgi:tRNA threonylcarbamoyladenosine biosynthesis protein TsaE